MNFNEFAIEYQKVIDGAVKPFELMRELNMTKPTFYRYKKRLEKQQ